MHAKSIAFYHVRQYTQINVHFIKEYGIVPVAYGCTEVSSQNDLKKLCFIIRDFGLSNSKEHSHRSSNKYLGLRCVGNMVVGWSTINPFLKVQDFTNRIAKIATKHIRNQTKMKLNSLKSKIAPMIRSKANRKVSLRNNNFWNLKYHRCALTDRINYISPYTTYSLAVAVCLIIFSCIEQPKVP